MNENERTPAETAADYAVHFADGFFVPCPCCGKEVKSPDNGFTSEKEAMEWALGACDCAGAKAWQQQRPALRMDSPCMAGKMKAGRCGHTAYTARCTGSACSAYHPELYAPDLYARAFDLYAKRKAEEKEWAEFHPAATIISRCSWTRQQAKFCRTVAGTTAQEPRKWKRLNRHGFAKSSSHGWTTNRRP